ncbi:MAG: hypothetical protein ACRECF_02460 [Methyloceanibacter sp.]
MSGQSYLKAPTKYSFRFDAGNNGNETFTIFGPKGKKGRLVNYGVEAITEAFVAECTIAVGTAADPDAYGDEIALGAQAVDTVESLRTLYDPVADKAAFDALLVQPHLPADTAVVMTVVDDTTSGIGEFFMEIVWDD